ncbi:MAG TPA: MBL fold metallo-hydrolase [Chondromyces sp.]|nr:MBL fold metallo-hydrolase [Chondromyces sp.]
MMNKAVDLGFGISLIDLMDLGEERRTGTYVIEAEELTIIETSASPSIPYLIEGLREVGYQPEDIKHIIVTHIHLDHAGGAGLLLESCPNANVYVHPKGKRHLADPSRLIKGAKAVYGEQFDDLFNPILPIPEGRLVEKADGETLEIGENRILTFLDTPGHANHHFSIYDPASKGIFTGDTIGVSYPQLMDEGIELYLPSTSPNQFNPEAMLESAKRIEELGIERIYFGHYGMSPHPDEVLKQLRYWLPKYVEAGEKALRDLEEATFEVQAKAIAANLFEMISNHLDHKNVSRESESYNIIQLDINVSSMGLTDYLLKKVTQ